MKIWPLLTIAFFYIALSGCANYKHSDERLLELVSIELARQSDDAGYGLISTDELAGLLDQKEPVLIVDARKEYDFVRGHIPGAVMFTFPRKVIMSGGWNLERMRGRTEADFERFLGADKGMLLVFSCGRTRCARSHNAAMWAVRLGYHNVFRHPGGIDAWKEADLSVESGL